MGGVSRLSLFLPQGTPRANCFLAPGWAELTGSKLVLASLRYNVQFWRWGYVNQEGVGSQPPKGQI